MLKRLKDWLALPRVVWHLMRQSPQARARIVEMAHKWPTPSKNSASS